MRKLFLNTFLFTFILFISQARLCFAQDEDTTITPPVEDTITATLDSIAKNLSDSAYYDEEEDYYTDDTLYFLLKNDTTSIFDSSVFIFRGVPDSIVNHLKNNNDFWYANKDFHEKRKEEKSESPGNGFLSKLLRLLANDTFRLVMWIIIIACFAAAVLWFLSRNKMNIWSSSKGPAIVRNKQEGEVDDIFTTDLKAEIVKAEQKQDFRLAIRFHYLHLLKLFSNHSIIKYTQDATNMEYLTQLYGKPFYREFFKVTRNYEYAWYGEIDVNAEQYKTVVKEFMELYTKTSVSW